MQTVADRFGFKGLIPGQYRPKRLRNGLIFIVVVAYLAITLFTHHAPFWPSHPYRIRAVFGRADWVRGSGSVVTEVRENGVKIGQVSGVTLNSNASAAVVTMTLDHRLELHANAHASLLFRLLLGRNMYIAIDPGSPHSPPLPGNTIPLRNTDYQTEVDEALAPLDHNGRVAFQQIITGTDQAFANTEAVAGTIDGLPPALPPTTQTLDSVQGIDSHDLPDLVQTANKTFAALTRSDTALAGVVNNAAIGLAATAAQHEALSGLVAVAPAAEAETTSTMIRLRSTLNALDPLVNQLEPGARALHPALSSLNPTLAVATPLLQDLKPTLASTDPAVRALAAASTNGTPVVQTLQPTLDRLASTTLPWLAETDPDTKLRNYEAIGPVFSDVDSGASNYDANGYVLQFQPGASTRTIEEIPCRLMLTNPTATQLVQCDELNSLLQQFFSGGGTPSTSGAQNASSGGSALPVLQSLTRRGG
jgi:phospholipid/cholesterol/gamma-HCH transport system substrate-binding protein